MLSTRSRAVLKDIEQEITIDRQTAPGFLLLYQQSVLLELKEQTVINDAEYRRCMEALTHRFHGSP